MKTEPAESASEASEADSINEEIEVLKALAACWDSRAESDAKRWEEAKSRKEPLLITGRPGYGRNSGFWVTMIELTIPTPEQTPLEQKAAAQYRVTLDQKLNRVTPAWIKELSEE